MPSDARRLHGFTVVSGALGLARQLVLPAILGGASAGDDVATTLQWVVALLTIPSILLAFLRWVMFRFRLLDDELVIDSGVVSRRRRVIPLARIQNIDLEQSALERLVGVASVRMETASGGETEASLSVLALPEARELQAELMRRRTAARARRDPASLPDEEAPAVPAETPPSRRLLRLSVPDLALAGATSNEAGLIAAGLATALEVADDLGGLDRVGAMIEGAVAGGAALGVLGVAAVVTAVVLAFVVLGWALSVVVSVVRYHGFTLTREGEEIRREYGLLSRHHSTVPLERVQAVRIEETLLRRAFGLVALKIETAGTRPGQRRSGGGEAEAFVPIARRRDVGRLLREVFEDARFEGVELHPVARVSLRREFVRLAVPIILGSAVAGLVAGPRWLAGLLLLGPALLYARSAYRARGWARPRAFALVRGGVFTRVTWVVPERKIQTLHVRETPFQRRLDLGTLFVDTAAGGRVAHVVDLDRGTARQLLAGLATDAEAERRRALRPAPRGYGSPPPRPGDGIDG
jgi:putative membrane protein